MLSSCFKLLLHGKSPIAAAHLPFCALLCRLLSTLQAAQEAAVLTVRKDELGQLRKAIPLRVGMQVRQAAGPSHGCVSQRAPLSCCPNNTCLARCCLGC